MDRKNIRLPEDASALSGAGRLWPYQRAVSDAIKHEQRLQFLFPRMAVLASNKARILPNWDVFGLIGSLDAAAWLCEYPGPSSLRSPVCACSLVSSLLLVRATMSQDFSLTQSGRSVR
jgi:hypothetical protein